MDERSALARALAGRYEVDREVGRGGMATVYLARDIRHDRRVAVKVLHPDLAAALGAERFLAEIKTTANLQHPHILPLHDSGEADGLLYYVMPFIEGETLRGRLVREKMLPIDDALRITKEALSALDYAHRHGVVHRDVKPENILLHDGSALVADFGIALAVTAAGGARMTQTGLSLGTPQYMSPEQAMGERTIDGRADVYATGAILYEMLTGDPPFIGSTLQAIVAKVITEKPSPPTAVRTTIPMHVELAVLTALAKSPADRFSTAAKFAEALDGRGAVTGALTSASMGKAAGARSRRMRTGALVGGVAIASGAIGYLVSQGARPSATVGVVRAQLVFPASQEVISPEQGPAFALSRDGSLMVYSGPAPDGRSQLWVRRMDELTAKPIKGTNGGALPAISPDNREVAFDNTTDRKLRIVAIEGGVPRTIADSVRRAGLTWGSDNLIYYRTLGGGAIRIAPSGGTPEQLSNPVQGTSGLASGHLWPDPLPGGKALIVTVRAPAMDNTQSRIGVLEIGSQKVTELTTGVYARFIPGGYLAWATADGTVFTATFDTRTFALGRPRLAMEQVRVEGSLGSADFAFSESGRLIYQTGVVSEDELVWMSKTKPPESINVSNFRQNLGGSFAMSPDGRTLALSRGSGYALDIWVKSLTGGTLARLTTQGAPNISPSWTADGRYLAFSSIRGGRAVQDLYIRRADGTGTDSLLLRRSGSLLSATFSPDGKWMAFVEGNRLFFKQNGPDTTTTSLTATDQFREGDAAFSPDSRFVAYSSQESGPGEVYVRPFPDVAAGKWVVSIAGGRAPKWSRSGNEIFYWAPQALMSAKITRSPAFAVVRRDTVLRLDPMQTYPYFEPSADGQRFLMVRSLRAGTGLVLVENWFNEVRAAGRP